MDDRLSLSVTHADGRVTRWGPDELEAGDIPNDLTFSTSMPGGFRDLSCSLLRRIDLDYPDQGLFDNVRAYGPGNRTAWDGRFTQFPRSHGQGFSVTPGAVGWAAHLRDDPSFMEVYVDRDLSRWQPPSRTRQVALVTANIPHKTDPSAYVDSTTGLPSLHLEVPGAWAAPYTPRCEAWYDASPGVAVASMYYDFSSGSGTTWVLVAYSADGDDDTDEGSSDLYTATTGTGTYTPATARRYAAWLWAFSSTPAGADGAIDYIDLRRLAVFGNHGLTKRGSTPDQGFYVSDMIADIVSRAAPLLDTSGVETTDFVVPHAAFHDPVTAEDAISLLNGFHYHEWGVYDDRIFIYRPTNPDRLTWEARLDQGAFLDLEGDTAEQVFNGVYVAYQDAAGTRKTIGPTGANADATSALLADTSETNPVNAHGIPRRWAKLEISVPTTQAGAEQLGYVWLREHSLPQRRGNLNLVGSVTHPTEGDVPVWRVRAGDYIRPTDMPGYVPRRIISTTYNHGQRQLSAELDNTSLKLDSILERLGVGMVGVL